MDREEEELSKIIEEAKREERLRINKEFRSRPFGWCSVCVNIPCQCK